MSSDHLINNINPVSGSPWLSGYRLMFLYFVGACLLFGQLYNAGFVTDFLGWLECRETTPVWRAYECFGNRGLYFIPFLILGFLTGIFGLHPLPWFIVWIGMHAMNAWLVTDVSRRLFDLFNVRYPVVVPYLAGVIFMIHPWQVEVLAWKACANYLASCLLMLLTLRAYLQYVTSGSTKYYWISVGTYFLFLFTLEFALLFPAIIVMLLWSLSSMSFIKRFAGILVELLPYLVAIALWFIANKLLFGLWVGHYGAETHGAVDPLAMSSVVLKYLVKTLALTRFFGFHVQTDIYMALDYWIIGAAMFGLLLGLVIMLVLRNERMSNVLRLRLFLFLSAVVFIIPVTNLYFYYLQNSENDRYTYLAIAFLGMWLLSLCWSPGKWIGKAIVLLFIVGCLWGTISLVHIWEKSATAYWQHIKTFPQPQASEVFLLNVPDNYRGTFMFRNIGGDSAFEEVYRYLSAGKTGISKQDFTGKMYDVFQYNMTGLSNDFIVTRETENRIRVEFAQWGNWWWRNGVGAEKYSNEEYTAWPEGKWYYVEFKNPLTDAQVLYYTPEGWKRIGEVAEN